MVKVKAGQKIIPSQGVLTRDEQFSSMWESLVSSQNEW